MIHLRALLCLAFVSMGACEKKVVEVAPLTVDRFGRTSQVGRKPEALTMKEVAFMVRAQTAETEIMAELARRGLAEPVDESARRLLSEAGAAPGFVEKLANSPLILTVEERQLYAQRLDQRTTAAASAANAHDRWIERNRVEISNKVHAAQSALMAERRKELSAKMSKLSAEQANEKYSRNSSSPYQRYNREMRALSAEIANLH